MSPTSIECSSVIARVVVYARGAVVTRSVALPEALPEGPVELVVPGVTALADPGSVRALAGGDREVTALSARLSLPAAPRALGALEARKRALRLDRARLEAEGRSLVALREALSGVAPEPTLSRWARRLDPAARFADALAVGGLLGAELARLDGLVHLNVEALEKNGRDTEAARIAAAQGSSAEVAGEPPARLEVRVLLGAGQGALRALEVEYVVGAARWWPAYTARFSAAATQVSLAIDAFVAQSTGEDWGRVRLSLSTAHLAHDARLPELRSLRLGRAQPAPRRGYRPPPEGMAALFEGYDRAVLEGEERRRPPASQAVVMVDALLTEGAAGEDGWGGGSREALDALPPGMMSGRAEAMTRAPGGHGGPSFALGAPQAAPQGSLSALDEDEGSEPVAAFAKSAPPAMRMRRAMVAPSASYGGEERSRRTGKGGAAPSGPDSRAEPLPPAAIEPGEAWLDFDALVLADPGDRARRGRLVRAPAASAGEDGRAASARFERLEAPPLTRDPFTSRGHFDHRYDAEGTSDVPSSGRPHRVPVTSAEADATPRFVAVPREVAEVYREVEILNPFAAPLLGGPVDVFLDGALMTTSELAFVDRKGKLYLGLGVEERLRVARNARVEETTAGILGGSAVVDHAVTIELSSSLGRAVTVEVLERIPVTDDKDVEVKLTYARPELEKYTQAERGAPLRRGARFRVEVPAGEKAKIELGYRVTLPAKNELVGGNRRE